MAIKRISLSHMGRGISQRFLSVLIIHELCLFLRRNGKRDLHIYSPHASLENPLSSVLNLILRYFSQLKQILAQNF